MSPLKTDLNLRAFSRLGKNQKEIIKKMVVDDFFILETQDFSDGHRDIILLDDHGNEDRVITNKEMSSLWNRGFLLQRDVSIALGTRHQKMWINKVYTDMALEAIRDIL